MKVTKFLYNSNLAKGTGLINETLTLIAFYEKNDTKVSFLNRCISQNILNKSTEKRTKDIITLVFYPRYWNDTGNVIPYLKKLRENGLSLEGMRSLMLYYTAKANPVLKDFIFELVEINNHKKIQSETARNFLLQAMSDYKVPLWSDSIIKRVSSYLISCLKDFDLMNIEGHFKTNYPIQTVINYLIHEFHFQGKSDAQIVKVEMWKLFGLTNYEVIGEIEKLSFKGNFIFQYSGQILNIGWKYKNMDQLIENEYR